MPILEIKNKQVVKLSQDDLNGFLVQEQKSVRAIVRDSISTISPNLMVITENFKDTTNDVNHIDLLCLDRDLNLVVVEYLEADAKSFDLSSIRNSAHVSELTFDEIVKIHQDFLKKSGNAKDDAQEIILKFTGKSYLAVKAKFPGTVKIVLISKESQPKIMTTINWLKQNGMNISWVSINRIQLDNRLLVEVDDIIAEELPSKQTTSKNKPEVKPIPKDEATKAPAKKDETKKTSAPESKATVEKKANPDPKPSAPAKKSEPASKPEAKVAKKETTPPANEKSQKAKAAKVADAKPKAVSNNKKQTTNKADAPKVDKTQQKSKVSDANYYDLSIRGKSMPGLPKRRVVFRTLRFIFAALGVTPDELFKTCKSSLPVKFMIKIKGKHDAESFAKLASEKRKKEGMTFDSSRYFCKDNELLDSDGHTYSIFNQWTAENFDIAMSKLIKTYSDSENEIKYSPSK